MRNLFLLSPSLAAAAYALGSGSALASPPTPPPAASALPTEAEITAFYLPDTSKIDRIAGDAENPLKTAMSELSAEHYLAAGAKFTSALILRPRFSEAKFCRALCSEGLKKWDFAVVDFTAFLASRPKFYDGYVERARSYKMLGDLKRARADVAAAEGIKPARDDAYQIFGDKNPTKK